MRTRLALAVLQAVGRPAEHSSGGPRRCSTGLATQSACWPKLDQTMTSPMTGHAYAALLRRTARGGGVTADGGRRGTKKEGAQRVEAIDQPEQ